MGLVEVVCVEPQTWRATALGKELDVELFQVFMGLWYEWEIPIILEDYHLIDEEEADALCACLGKADAKSVLIAYMQRAYFEYRKAAGERSARVGAPDEQRRTAKAAVLPDCNRSGNSGGPINHCVFTDA
jgi:hypothetical protein